MLGGFNSLLAVRGEEARAWEALTYAFAVILSKFRRNSAFGFRKKASVGL